MKDIIGVRCMESVNGGVAIPTIMSDSYSSVEYFFERTGENYYKNR